jgi:hypothetical protein
MSDRPILFSAPMIRALLDGRKTQTRRVMNPQPATFSDESGRECEVSVFTEYGESRVRLGRVITMQRLRYTIGDRLWVRESGELIRHADEADPATGCDVWNIHGWRHAADGQIVGCDENHPVAEIPEYIGDCDLRKSPSIHMPRWASRLTLTVTDVRIERLHSISKEDAIAEGIDKLKSGRGFYDPRFDHGAVHAGIFADPRDAYAALWNQINGQGAWYANPWVSAYTFTVARHNIDAEAP